ncbi:HEPN family nuclease [Hymenobacter artigasi]|uniref:pEK499-p136 HEPN domain-containing protein n=1 Tax=Hymenobacter artigasi TaxID=2719616 RepID=A0ABX1HQX1_9BACT|nr:HEPN family nuclease [Hymenobacter artigasi]NKI91598.1 hypothetical protein [Hymenobacter artigasi]
MSESINYPIDIVKRTQYLLKESRVFADDYEVTFLVNCLLGLLVAANEFDNRNGKKLRDKNLSTSLLNDIPETLRFISINSITKRISVENDNVSWQILDKNALSTDAKKSDYNLGWFLGKLRNGIAHQHIEAINTEGKWTGIKLWNESERGGTDFVIVFSILSLKKLTLSVADIYLTTYQSTSSE